MRISVNTNDPGNANFNQIGLVKVFLDGKEVENVITADEEQGFVIRVWLDENGKEFIDKATGTLQLENLHGVVTIEPIPLPKEIKATHDDAADNPAI